MGLTKPRPRKAVSQATISKLSTATGAWQAGDLSPRSPSHAPDGGSWANYRLGHRFLPENVLMPAGSKTFDGREAEGLWSDTIMKNEARFPQKVAESKTGTVIYGNTTQGMQIVQAMKDLHNSNGNNPKAQKVIDDHYYNLVIAPQIKAQEEQLAKQREAKELEYAMMKMRVIELEKKPAPVVSISTDNNWSKYAILGIGVVIFLIILRRRK